MKVSITALLAVHQRDSSLPFWLANVDADSLFAAHSHRPEKAQAWLRFRNVSESCFGFEQAVLMNGHFEGGVLSSHTYHWTFTPGRRGDLAIVTPVLDGGRLVDFVAMSRHDHNVWAACVGTGFAFGRPIAYAQDCDGILPLSKAFFPQLRNAPKLVAEDDAHAWDLAYRVFIDPEHYATDR